MAEAGDGTEVGLESGGVEAGSGALVGLAMDGAVMDRDAEGAGGGEAGEDTGPGRDGDGVGVPVARAAGAVSRTALMPRASGVNHLGKGLLPERDDDAA